MHTLHTSYLIMQVNGRGTEEGGKGGGESGYGEEGGGRGTGGLWG
jgi:hypothetical protein